MAKMSKANVRQIGWAALGVVAGIVVFNNLQRVAGSTVVGKLLDGSLLRAV